jgi:alkanesulfonate monooxygenase SsuD/methylene tetrahydromethanopterin reductase-like flavin-dependent oxidoreductase (luciferase family)
MKLGFSPIQGGQRFEEMVEQVRYAETNGLDSVFLQEHHEVTDDPYWPDPLSVLTGLATVTDSIELGAGILLLPLYNPIRLAERGAILDNLSDGRLIVGAAVGYRPRDFDVFSVPRESRGRILTEYLTLLSRLWTEDEVTFDGEHYQVESFRCTPPPRQSPRPRIWLGGYHDVVLRRTARFNARGHVDGWFPGIQPSIDGLVDRRDVLDAELHDRGAEPDDLTQPVLRDGVIAETTEQAVELAEEYLVSAYEAQYKGHGYDPSERGDLGHDVIHSDGYEPRNLIEDRFIVGDPDDWAEELERYETEFGADHVVVRLYANGMTHEDVLDQLELICEEVVPAL